MTRYWFDTEFMEDGNTIELLSIGMICEDGREFYAQNAEADLSHANEWVRENVLPHLSAVRVLSRAQIAAALIAFVAERPDRPEFWAYYGDYDWVVLCQLFGRMVDLPAGWPMFAMDVKQLAVSVGNPRLPEQDTTAHNALNDARWTRTAWQYLMELPGRTNMAEPDDVDHWFVGTGGDCGYCGLPEEDSRHWATPESGFVALKVGDVPPWMRHVGFMANEELCASTDVDPASTDAFVSLADAAEIKPEFVPALQPLYVVLQTDGRGVGGA